MQEPRRITKTKKRASDVWNATARAYAGRRRLTLLAHCLPYAVIWAVCTGVKGKNVNEHTNTRSVSVAHTHAYTPLHTTPHRPHTTNRITIGARVLVAIAVSIHSLMPSECLCPSVSSTITSSHTIITWLYLLLSCHLVFPPREFHGISRVYEFRAVHVRRRENACRNQPKHDGSILI